MTDFKEQLSILFDMEDLNYGSVAVALMYEELDDDLFTSHSIQTKIMQSHGGEGEGSDYYTVYSFTKDDETVYVKFQGWYASYYGADYDSWKFVEPKQKTTTVYE